MSVKRDYSPFDRINERWPTLGDRIFSPGRDATVARDVGERIYRLGQGYKLAGDVLVQNSLGEPRDHDNLVYPILYCYRHYIEITLKEIIEKHGQWIGVTLSKRDHKLPELWGLFLRIAIEYHNDPSDDAALAVSACIDELAQVDPSSVAFRYARDKKTNYLIPLPFAGIDLVNLHDVMNGIANFFECADLAFDHERDRTTLLSGQKVNSSNWLLSVASSSRSDVAKIADWIGIFSNTVSEKTCSNV